MKDAGGAREAYSGLHVIDWQLRYIAQLVSIVYLPSSLKWDQAVDVDEDKKG